MKIVYCILVWLIGVEESQGAEQHFECPSISDSRLCVTEKENCEFDGCVCKPGYVRAPSCADGDHASVYCACIDQNECIQDSPPCPEEGSFCVDYDPPERYKCGCRFGFIPVLPSSTTDPVPREWRPLACVLTAVDTVVIADVMDGGTIDTGSGGTATGSFMLQGSAPPGTTNVLLQILSDDGTEEVVEEAEAEIFSEDLYETKWGIEVNALQSGDVSFVVVAFGPFGSRSETITVNLILPGPDEALLQPSFAFTSQFYDRLLSYDATTGALEFSSDLSASLRPGNGLSSGPIDLAPDGYLRIVTNVDYESSSGTTVVMTRQAGLAEFMRRISLSYRTENQAASNDTSFELGGARQRRSLLQIGPNTNLNVNLNFDPSASVDIDIGWDKGDSWVSISTPVLEKFFFEVGFEFKGVVSLEHTEQFINIPLTKFGPDIEGTFGRILIPTPFLVPILVTFEFETSLKYSVQLETQLVVEYSPKLGFKAGYEYLVDGTGRGSYTMDTSSASETDIDLAGKASLTVQSEVEVQALLFGAVGIEVECSPGLVFEAVVDVVDGECNWKVDLAVPFEAGVELEIEFGPFETEVEFAVTFLTISLTLLSGTVQKIPSTAPSFSPSMALPSGEPTNVLPSVTPTMEMPSAEPTPLPTPPPTSPPPTPSPTPPPPPKENNNCGATSDPHFFSWTTRYSYQGACDLVFVRNSMVEVQIRTKFGSNGRFSFVSNAAISIGGDILEVVSNRTYFVNGIEPSNGPPATIGGTYPLTVGPSGSFFQVSLSGGQQVRVSFYRNTITLEIAGHLSDFGASVGFMGSYGVQEFPYRDGTVPFLGFQIGQNVSDYANEWAVAESKGDMSLFVTSPETEGCVEASSFTPDPSILQMAEAACASLPDDGTRQNCIFDILATGEMAWAANPGFTDPLQPAGLQCAEEGRSECVSLGGECRWRCNDNEFACLPGICTAADELPVFDNTTSRRHLSIIEGCSCALPLPSPTSSPTTFPTVSQSRLNEIITCIAVIDESRGSQSLSGFQNLWANFRELYPERPFCLLQPEPNQILELFVPEAFLNDTNTIYSPVSRDFGVEVEASDWFDICGLESLRSQGILDVAIFIDNSGSLTTPQVQASNNLLLSRMEAEGLNLVAGLSNSREDWISPFLTDFE